MVVVNANSLTTEEQNRTAAIISWGYTVGHFNQSAPQAVYNEKFLSCSVIFVSEEVYSSQIKFKLTNAPIGVVSEENAILDELGMSYNGAGNPYFYASDGDYLKIVNNTHYITSNFSSGQNVKVFTQNFQISNVVGPAPGLRTLANAPNGRGPGLVYMLPGDILTTPPGGVAQGRRVILPWGDEQMRFSYLTQNGGLQIMRRAIEWGMGIGDD